MAPPAWLGHPVNCVHAAKVDHGSALELEDGRVAAHKEPLGVVEGGWRAIQPARLHAQAADWP
eukprot:scaffold55524_cov41-Tisochrysis_lutea.AAC.4